MSIIILNQVGERIFFYEKSKNIETFNLGIYVSYIGYSFNKHVCFAVLIRQNACNIPDSEVDGTGNNDTPDDTDRQTGVVDDALTKASEELEDAKDDVDDAMTDAKDDIKDAVDDADGNSIAGVLIAILIAVAIIILIIVMVSKNNGKYNRK